jgi:transcriptional regulator with XRE-family HTH domain
LSNEPPLQRRRLATALRRLRWDAGLSGEELARRTGFSQSKVSRIETAATVPSRADVEAWCRAVDASDDERADLLDLARIVAVEVRSARRSSWHSLM